jgi:hypothetical protein
VFDVGSCILAVVLTLEHVQTFVVMGRFSYRFIYKDMADDKQRWDHKG